MPVALVSSISRRSFLTLTAAGVAVAGMTSAIAAQDGALHLALLSDTHVPGDRQNGHRGFNPWQNLKHIVPDIVAAQPDAAIVCGDAARLSGLPEDYKEFSALLEPLAATAPVYVGLGNHDNREVFLQTVAKPEGTAAPVDDKHVSILEHPKIRILVLDSLLYVDKVAGLLGKAQREWLGNYLGEHHDRPVVLFIHHTLGDGDSDLLDSDRLFALLAPHKHVKAIFYGHSHRWGIGERQGIRLINLPAVGYNFSDDQPVGWVDARFDQTRAQLTLHAFGGNQADDGKTTEVVWG